jgi:hypothetical protein
VLPRALQPVLGYTARFSYTPTSPCSAPSKIPTRP